MSFQLRHIELLVWALARVQGLEKGERALLQAALDTYDRLVQGPPEDPIPAAIATLQRAARSSKAAEKLGGKVQRRSVRDRYVVMSDHHMAHEGHRHDLFRSNAGLYVHALAAYAAEDYVLVENGDVEELIIFDPRRHPDFPDVARGHEMFKRRELSLELLQARRRICRRIQLEAILKSPGNAPVIAAQRHFHERGRWVRIAGNHDHDVQGAAFPPFAETYDGVRRPNDYLFLTDDPDDPKSPVRYAVMHGHQFDANCCAKNAPAYGEVISETLGVFFQGSDRVWRFRNDIGDWIARRVPVNNVLSRTKEGARGVAEIDAHLSRMHGAPAPTQLASSAAEDSTIADLVETLFGSRIAWEHFEHRSPRLAILTEVLTGDEWFKLRHNDEVSLDRHLAQAFPDPSTRPSLVLGHTHEPRLSPGYPDRPGRAAFYLNSGSVGRYERLVWALEIVDGQPQIVSWVPNGSSARRIEWRPEGEGAERVLTPATV